MPILSWMNHHLQAKTALNTLFSEGQCHEIDCTFLDEIYMGYSHRHPQMHDVSKLYFWRIINQFTGIQAVETQEASLVLEVVCAQREVCHAEQLLAECLVCEHKKTANLHHFKAKQKQRSVNNKDLDIGWIKAAFNNHSQSQESASLPTPSLPQKVPGTNGTMFYLHQVLM